MSEKIKMKKIRVRQGMTGFYTSILESGQVAMIPADQKATKEGWFDDVDDNTPVDIGAPSLTAGISFGGVEQYGDGSGPVHRSQGTTDQEIDLQQETPPQSPKMDAATSDKGSDQDAVKQASESKASEDPKEATKADIIAELESLGVQEFNRSANKAELQARLTLVKDALAQGE